MHFANDLIFGITLIAQAGGGGNFGGSSSGGGGGGGGFSSGGGGGGGYSYDGGSGGEGGGDLFRLIFQLTIDHPLIALPCWALVIYFAIKMYSAGHETSVTRRISRGQSHHRQNLIADASDAIRRTDRAFNATVFLKRAEHGFVTIQKAWSEQDLRLCRAFISDGVYERFELYIRMQQAEGYRNRVENVTVTDAEIVGAVSEPHFDTIHVRFEAAAQIVDEEISDGKPPTDISNRPKKSFSEVWSFSRRQGVATNQRLSLMDGECPNCGGSVKIVDRATCAHCDSVVNSGQYDWVLSEITQDCEWTSASTSGEIPGWNEMTAIDPGLNLQQLEDRASVIFWRCMMSLYFDEPGLARPMLSDKLNQIPELWHSAEMEFWKTPAMGAVRVYRCMPGTEEEPVDRIDLLLRWSGTKGSGSRRKPALHGEQTIFSHRLTMARRSGVMTQVERAFSSLSCSACGAPIDTGSTETCRFCDAALNAGGYEWVMESLKQHDPFEPISLPAQKIVELPDDPATVPSSNRRNRTLPVGIHASEVLTVVAGLLLVDGEFGEHEKRFLSQLAARQKIPAEQLKQCLAAARLANHGQGIKPPTSEAHVLFLMQELFRAAFSDGKVSEAEFDFLLRMSAPLRWSRIDLKQAISRTRRDLLQEVAGTRKRVKKVSFPS
jgi:hypothetical protein